MQSKTTLKRISGFIAMSLLMLFFSFTANVSVHAQQYVNGNLTTGVTASNGTAAPAGYEWSEVQTGNSNAGFGAQLTGNLSLADDFTVPTGGGNWTVSKVTLYAYSTGYTGTTSPFTDLKLQIFNTDP
jgi:hypothetical protein